MPRPAPPCLLVFAVLALACEPDAGVAAICGVDGPVQLLASGDGLREVATRRAADVTLLYLRGADDRLDTYVGADCGARPVRVLVGDAVHPARAHLEPDDDDPHFACLGQHFLHLTLRPGDPPAIFLPNFSCAHIEATAHGPLITGGNRNGFDSLWLFPALTDPDGAVEVTEHALAFHHEGETLYYLDKNQVLRTFDLATHHEAVLRRHVASFTVHETHLLWREYVDDEDDRMHLVDLTTAAEIDLGLYRLAVDDGAARPPNLPVWSFSATGQHILHVPRTWAEPEAFTLTGARRSLPMPGAPLFSRPDDLVIGVTIGDGQLFAVRPGDASPTLLDARAQPDIDPSTELQTTADGLYLLRDDALYAIPLDGAPARRLAEPVGGQLAWLDERRVLTSFADTLVTIDLVTGERTSHARHVPGFHRRDDGALYYLVDRPGHPDSGLWYVPAGAPLPAP